MRKWKLSDDRRDLMIREVFKAGYNGPEERDMQRWTVGEMTNLCTDEDLLSLFIRYVTWYPAMPGRDKEVFIKEVEAEIAVEDMLA